MDVVVYRRTNIVSFKLGRTVEYVRGYACLVFIILTFDKCVEWLIEFPVFHRRSKTINR